MCPAKYDEQELAHIAAMIHRLEWVPDLQSGNPAHVVAQPAYWYARVHALLAVTDQHPLVRSRARTLIGKLDRIVEAATKQRDLDRTRLKPENAVPLSIRSPSRSRRVSR